MQTIISKNSRLGKVRYWISLLCENRIWNIVVLLMSSLALCIVFLPLAIGQAEQALFIDYLKHPLIVFLNWLPMLLVQFVFLCLFNRQWLAFAASSIIFGAAHAGNFFKFQFRYEPFTFSDMKSIMAGLEIADKYDIQMNSRIWLMLACIIAGTLFMLLFAHGRMKGKSRIAGVLLTALSIWPLWSFVYSSAEIYEFKTKNDDHIDPIWQEQIFISKGFVYPFIYSIRLSKAIAPEGYDEEVAKQLLDGIEDENIAADDKVNIMVVQLESFCDLEELGLEGIDPVTYEYWHELSSESMVGTLVPNVIGGGTIDTERSFVSGSCGMLDYKQDAPSYVRYLNSQGYTSVGSHPNRKDYYNRLNINKYLGFDDYWFTNNHYGELTGGEWYCDDVFMPEIFKQFTELSAQGRPVFSFNVSLQGHSPYNSSELEFDKALWNSDGISDSTHYVVNNYLGSLYETQSYLRIEIDKVRNNPEPMVLLIYGDHKPAFDTVIYDECGISTDRAGMDGFMNYYSTPYIIWANDAAKALTGKDFSGKLPIISPGYMMNVLFGSLGWKGNAFMQFTSEIMETLPVVHSSGYYIENGNFTQTLSEESMEMLQHYRWLQFYQQQNFSTK